MGGSLRRVHTRYDEMIREIKEYFFEGFEWPKVIKAEKISGFEQLLFKYYYQSKINQKQYLEVDSILSYVKKRLTKGLSL